MTNIFLVNNGYRLNNNPKNEDGVELFSSRYLGHHVHTYWLKYMVLQMISRGGVDKREVLDIFCSGGSAQAFDEHIVKLVLFSLSEVAHGRLIRPKAVALAGGRVGSGGIETTKRAEYLLENGVFWKFPYLACVIEDEWLEWPHPWTGRFSRPLGFRFLEQDSDEEFDQSYRLFLQNKEALVMDFVDLLDAASSEEKRRFPFVYERLERRHVVFPDFDVIRSGIRSEIDKEFRLLGDDPERLQLLRSSLRWLRRQRNTSVIRRYISNSYSRAK